MQRLHKIGTSLFTRLTLSAVMMMMIASFSIPAFAEDVYHLLVKMKNDEEKAFVLSKKPVVSFTDTECVVDYEGYTGYFKMADIKDLTITTLAGVDEIAADRVTLDFTSPSEVVVRGVQAGGIVTLHTVTGILIDTVYADSEGNARIDMSAVSPSTICILTVNSSKNFKIYKK